MVKFWTVGAVADITTIVVAGMFLANLIICTAATLWITLYPTDEFASFMEVKRAGWLSCLFPPLPLSVSVIRSGRHSLISLSFCRFFFFFLSPSLSVSVSHLKSVKQSVISLSFSLYSDACKWRMEDQVRDWLCHFVPCLWFQLAQFPSLSFRALLVGVAVINCLVSIIVEVSLITHTWLGPWQLALVFFSYFFFLSFFLSFFFLLSFFLSSLLSFFLYFFLIFFSSFFSFLPFFSFFFPLFLPFSCFSGQRSFLG